MYLNGFWRLYAFTDYRLKRQPGLRGKGPKQKIVALGGFKSGSNPGCHMQLGLRGLCETDFAGIFFQSFTETLPGNAEKVGGCGDISLCASHCFFDRLHADLFKSREVVRKHHPLQIT